jgi:hypothetical protein
MAGRVYNCDYCNKENIMPQSQYIKSKKHFCNKYCRNYSIIGESNPAKRIEVREKISKKAIGNKHGHGLKGKIRSKEHCLAISLAKKGVPNLKLKGHKLSTSVIENHRRLLIERGSVRGKRNGRWLGGKSFEPYSPEFNKYLKEHIKIRDNNECQECKNNKQLNIHHIDYNKKNNNHVNLITLCVYCHSKTNENREHWKEHFQMKMFIKEFFNPKNIIAYEWNEQNNARGAE